MCNNYVLQTIQIRLEHLPAQCEVAKHMFSTESTDQPMSAVDVYAKLSEMASAFPDLIACYQLMLTLPVASASAERSFSTMRRIKTHLRASMGDSRLSNLSLIAVEHEKSDKLLEIPDPVIDKFANLHARRIDLLL